MFDRLREVFGGHEYDRLVKYVERMNFPCSTRDLIEYARSHNFPTDAQTIIEQLPEQQFNSPEDIRKALSKIKV